MLTNLMLSCFIMISQTPYILKTMNITIKFTKTNLLFFIFEIVSQIPLQYRAFLMG